MNNRISLKQNDEYAEAAKESIEEIIEKTKIPGSVRCPVCQDCLFSPVQKLSIGLYGKCSLHLEADGYEERNILKIVEEFF